MEHGNALAGPARAVLPPPALLPRFSKFGFSCVALFVLLTILGRILFPFGDEPDFTVRAVRLVEAEEYPLWSPYYLLSAITSELNVESSCIIAASPLSLSASIDNRLCTESLPQMFLRCVLTFLVAAPLLVAVTYRRWSYRLASIFRGRIPPADWEQRLNAVSVSLVFPSIVYYLGVLSEEQLSLIVSLFLLLFYDRLLPLAALLALILSIDFGNGLVVCIYFCWFTAVRLVYGRFGLKFTLLASLALLTAAFTLGFSLVTYIPGGIAEVTQKAEAIYSALDGGVEVEKYPVILRPVITFISMIFFSPAYIKVPLAYVAVSMAIFFGFLRLKRQYLSFSKNTQRTKLQGELMGRRLLFPLTAGSLICFMTFVLPTYANAKYYVFLMPFLVYTALAVYSERRVRQFFLVITALVLLHLIVYRIHL